jgi:diadenosine tetraphosphate (Ap4A) HIT family hydrolase
MNSQLELPAFGKIEPNCILALDDLFAIVLDKFPISHGHTLIIARRRVARFLELSAEEKSRLLHWIEWIQNHLAKTFRLRLMPSIWVSTMALPLAKPCRSFISM